MKYKKAFYGRHTAFNKSCGEVKQNLEGSPWKHDMNLHLTPEVRDILKILWKRGAIAP